MICDINNNIVRCKERFIHNVPRIIMAKDEITERKETTYLLFSCIINSVSFKGLQKATHDRDAKFDVQKFEGE